MTDPRSLGYEVFDPIASDYLRRDGVDIGPMFGSEGIRIRGKVFAFVSRTGGLVAKVPAEHAVALESTGTAERMIMSGRRMREWVTIPASDPGHWRELIEAAYAYVDELTP